MWWVHKLEPGVISKLLTTTPCCSLNELTTRPATDLKTLGPKINNNRTAVY